MKQLSIPISCIRQYGAVFAILFLVAYGHNALSYLIADDNWLLLGNQNAQTKTVFRLGRWGQGFLLAQLDYEIYATVFWNVLLFASLTFSAWIIANILQLKNPHSFLALACVFATCPVWTEIFILTVNLVAAPFGVVAACLAAFAFSLCVPKEKQTLFSAFKKGGFYLGVVLLILALSIYQTYMFLTLIVLLFSCANMLLKQEATTAQVSHFLIALGVGVVIAIGLYICATYFIFQAFNLKPFSNMRYALNDNYVTSKQQLIGSIYWIFSYASRFLFSGQPLIPIATKVLLWGSVTLILLSQLYTVKSWSKHVLRIVSFRNLLIIFLVFCAVLLPWSFGLVRAFDPKSYRYSAVASSSLLFAIPVTLAIEYSAKSAWRCIAAKSFAAIMVAIFVLNISAVSFVIQQQNRREFAIVNRILAQIESHPKYSEINTGGILQIITDGAAHTIDPFEIAQIGTGNDEFLLAEMDHYSLWRCTFVGPTLCRSAFYALQYGNHRIKIDHLWSIRQKELRKNLQAVFDGMDVPSNQFKVAFVGSMVLVKFN